MPLNPCETDLKGKQDVVMEDISFQEMSLPEASIPNLATTDDAMHEVTITGAGVCANREAEGLPTMPRKMAAEVRRSLSLVGQNSATSSQHAASQREFANSSSTKHNDSTPALPSIYPDYYDGPYAASLSSPAR
jgi:hypothetical protein